MNFILRNVVMSRITVGRGVVENGRSLLCRLSTNVRYHLHTFGQAKRVLVNLCLPDFLPEVSTILSIFTRGVSSDFCFTEKVRDGRIEKLGEVKLLQNRIPIDCPTLCRGQPSIGMVQRLRSIEASIKNRTRMIVTTRI
jgi:hypothetical protein